MMILVSGCVVMRELALCALRARTLALQTTTDTALLALLSLLLPVVISLPQIHRRRWCACVASRDGRGRGTKQDPCPAWLA